MVEYLMSLLGLEGYFERQTQFLFSDHYDEMRQREAQRTSALSRILVPVPLERVTKTNTGIQKHIY